MGELKFLALYLVIKEIYFARSSEHSINSLRSAKG